MQVTQCGILEAASEFYLISFEFVVFTYHFTRRRVDKSSLNPFCRSEHVTITLRVHERILIWTAPVRSCWSLGLDFEDDPAKSGKAGETEMAGKGIGKFPERPKSLVRVRPC